MLRGAEALMDVCRSKIHHDQFHTNDQGTLSWEEVECVGACVNAPMVMIFKDTYEDLTPERLGEIIDAFAAGKGDSVPVGPQIDRIVSAPQTGLTTLRDEKAVLKTTREQGSDREAAAQPAPAATAAAGGRRCCRHPMPPSRRPTRPRPARRSSRRPRSRSRPAGRGRATSARRSANKAAERC